MSSRAHALFRSPHPSGHELKPADLRMLTLTGHIATDLLAAAKAISPPQFNLQT